MNTTKGPEMDADQRLADMRAKAQQTPGVDWSRRLRATQVPVEDRTDADWADADLAHEKI